MAQGRTILKKAGRIFLWLLVGILSLLVLVIIFINLPVGKRFIRDQVQSYLHTKLNTTVRIGEIDYALPEWLEIKNVYIEDQHKDTLLYGGELRVDLHMLKLLSGNTDIEKILLNNIAINVHRSATDSVFNYQFIVDAFSGNNPSTPNKDTAAMKLTMRQLIFDTVAIHFKDEFAGNTFYAGIKNLDLKMNQFQPDRMRFEIDEMYAHGVDYFMTTTKPQTAIEKPMAVDTIQQVGYPLFISAGKLDLRDVKVMLDNKVSGMFYQNKITHLSSSKTLFNVGISKGTTDELYLDSTTVTFVAPKCNRCCN